MGLLRNVWLIIMVPSYFACKQTDESASKSAIDIWGKDDTKQTVTVTVKGDETYLPKKLRDEFGKASFAALRDPDFNLQGLLGFSAQTAAKGLQAGTLLPAQFAEQMWPRENDDDARLLYYIQKTQNGLL